MDRKKILIVAGVGVLAIAVIIYIIWYFLNHGTLAISLDGSSEVKTNVNFWLSSDSYSKRYGLPQQIRLKAGSYTLQASGDNSDTYTTTFTIASGQTTTIKLLINQSPNQYLVGATDSTSTIKYHNLFPYNGGDFTITDSLSLNQETVTGVTVTIEHQIPTADQANYRQEHDLILAAAQKWLASNSIPSSIPVTIIDR